MITKIMVVTHKEYPMPNEDIYMPICVGAELENLKKKYQADDVGENISDKNAMYSELTALFWAWKNLQCDILGLVHYRRLLTVQRGAKDINSVLDKEQVDNLMDTYDLIVAKPRKYVETVKTHYINCQKGQKEKATRRIAILGDVINDLYPEYGTHFNDLLNGHKAHMFNIFIMKKNDADKYCEWLFNILFETENRINEEGVEYSRGMGELSEFLLDTWVQYHNLKYYEAGVIQYGYSFWQKAKFVIKRRMLGGNVK